jgi:hypothetical protein
MNRDIPFDADVKCEQCGKPGSFDFMGDVLCGDCAFPNLPPAAGNADDTALRMPPEKKKKD